MDLKHLHKTGLSVGCKIVCKKEGVNQPSQIPMISPKYTQTNTYYREGGYLDAERAPWVLKAIGVEDVCGVRMHRAILHVREVGIVVDLLSIKHIVELQKGERKRDLGFIRTQVKKENEIQSKREAKRKGTESV